MLDGLDEFWDATRKLDLKACIGLESRVFVPEFSDRVINSPGETGISFHMGSGFTTTQFPQVALDLLDGMVVLRIQAQIHFIILLLVGILSHIQVK